MPIDPEVERLKRVYQTYRESESTAARWSQVNRGNRLIIQERQRKIKKFLESGGFFPLSEVMLLDIGCGSGGSIISLIELGMLEENIHAVDLMPERVADTKERYPKSHLEVANAAHLEFPDGQFDLISLFTVLSSILDENMATDVCQEAIRLLKPGGSVLLYDLRYNNPANPNVVGVSSEKIRSLFPGLSLRKERLTVVPPLVRKMGIFTPILYPLMGFIPPLNTHQLCLLTKPK